MARPLRLEHEGAVWHVMPRGNERKNIFRADADRLLFLALLAAAVKRFNWIVHVYTLMSNHFHLVIETPEETLSRGMQWLDGQYARRFNKRHRRVGHLFQGRFHGQLVQKESHLLELTRYVVLNPVRAGMVERPEEYRWSSYRATVGLEAPPGWLTIDWVLRQFGADPKAAAARYAEFVDAGVGIARSPCHSIPSFFSGSLRARYSPRFGVSISSAVLRRLRIVRTVPCSAPVIEVISSIVIVAGYRSAISSWTLAVSEVLRSEAGAAFGPPERSRASDAADDEPLARRGAHPPRRLSLRAP